MSTIIGGPFKCSLHDIETDDVNEWNNHCVETGHTDSGTTQCTGCGVSIEFNDIPYQKITPKGKNIELKCEDCFNSGQDLNKMLYANNNNNNQQNTNKSSVDLGEFQKSQK